MSNHYDLAIVGGGLAGLTLSIQLARQGYEVVLFEKEKYPFHKVCGEYIAMESWPFLEACGIPLSLLNLPRITKLKVSSPNGNTLTHNLVPGGFGISRYTLDGLLADIAVKAGVKLMDGCRVDDIIFHDNEFSIYNQGNVFTSKVTIGSFGKKSNIDIKLKRKFVVKPLPPAKNYVGIKYHIKTDFPRDTIALHNFKDGYCGISKVDGDSYCLCYLTTAKNLQESGSIALMEKNILMKNPHLKNIFDNSEFLYSSPLVISQINFEDKSAIEQHVLMAGDAAGLITPLCGNGMSMALHSSKMLSKLIPMYLNGKVDRQMLEKEYTTVWKHSFSTRITIGRLIQYSFGREHITNLMISALKPFPALVGKLESMTHGEPF